MFGESKAFAVKHCQLHYVGVNVLSESLLGEYLVHDVAIKLWKMLQTFELIASQLMLGS